MDHIEKRVWYDPKGRGDPYHSWKWEKMPNDIAKLFLDMVIGIFSYNTGGSVKSDELDIAFFLKNPEFFGGKDQKNPHTFPELQGMEILFDGKIYKLPKIWTV